MKNNLDIQALNTQFGCTDEVTFIEGKGGFPLIQITNQKASALISVYAGQVLSFKPTNAVEDMMFVSDNAYFKEGKAIKGGIPICWPWFGGATTDKGEKLPDHGFVRDNFWTVASVDSLANGDTKIKLEFVDSEKTRKLWPHAFYLSLKITIGESLTLDLFAENRGVALFSMTEALHTYFNVGDSRQIEILGLERTEYLDKGEGFVPVCQIGAIKLSEATDHIHKDVKRDITINDPVFNRKIKIVSSGNKNVVVWNPWAKGAKKIADLDGEDYKHFICVEIANTTSGRIDLVPHGGYRLVTNYSVIHG
ncbi:MAG: D-hexose-6-phosphate mutarotase [Methylococcales bacterium]|nr:D-hexose-6-phosphate mutarotase [Methylococcales bacterium]